MKKCCTCQEVKAVEAFSRNVRRPDGRQDRCKTCVHAHYLKNSEKVIARTRAYAAENVSKLKEARKAWVQKNRPKMLAYFQEYNRKNYDPKYHRAYRAANLKRRADQRREKYHADPHYALTRRLSTRLNLALQGKTKGGTFWTLLGCDRQTLIAHLERQFVSGMSWANRGEWHVDHIKPLVSFDLFDPEQQRQACHFTNLQPLWALDNLKKGAKL